MEKHNFFQDVYQVAKLIPPGRVTSYGAIAAFLGAKSSARMVGWAMNGAGAFPEVPAHRVVNHQGLLTGKNHFEHPLKMQELLMAEGIEIKNDKVVHFEEVFWDPMKELSL